MVCIFIFFFKSDFCKFHSKNKSNRLSFCFYHQMHICLRRSVLRNPLSLKPLNVKNGAYYGRFASSTPDGALLFPWNHIEKTNLNFISSKLNLLSFNFMRNHMFQKLEIQNDDEILHGVEAAFRSAIDGIFSHSLNKLAESETKEQTIENAKAHMDSIFEKKLVKCFANSLDEMKEHNITMNYSLQSTKDYTIIDRTMTVGACRANMFPQERCAHGTKFGVRFLFDGLRREDASMANIRDKLQIAFLKGDLVLRIIVEVDCKGALFVYLNDSSIITHFIFAMYFPEIFFLEDANGVIIQGSKEPQDVTHQVLNSDLL